MSAPVTYLPGFVGSPDFAWLLYRDLHASLPWTRAGNTPRMECYFNDAPVPYAYGVGAGRRTYLPEPTWHPAVMVMRRRLEAILQLAGPLDVCFCNLYADQREQLGWHADDSPEMDDARPVVTVSLGVARQIWLRPSTQPTDPSTIERITLEPGSALVMHPGMQDAWEHRIPKHDRPCGPRISLTFRGYVAAGAA